MALGPVTLNIGQSTTASVQGFDQNGAPFAIDFAANPVTYTIDNSAIASSTPNNDAGQTDTVVGLTAGVANLTATCAGFNDTESVTVVAAAPVLSSIKLSFS